MDDSKKITKTTYSTPSQELWIKKRCLKMSTENLEIPQEFFMWRKWIVAEFRDIEKELNRTKSFLDNYLLDDWHQHTKRMNSTGLVMSTITSKFGPEYCSQAWCKMFECLSSFPLIPIQFTNSTTVLNAQPHFFSVHLCEGPGAFVSATNHFICTKYPQIQWDWLATTLNPHYEGNDAGNMISEDKLILSSIKNWIFLEDSTGNIINQNNLNCLIDQVEKKSSMLGQPVHLVTADGSIDCQKDPSSQELNVIELQFAEIVAALSILGAGGSFLLKIFTFLNCETINHLYVLCSLFKEVHLYKPATSQEGNSEVYVICLHYFGINYFRIQLQALKLQVGVKFPLVQRYSLISRKLAFRETFVNRILHSALFFTKCQVTIMNRNITTFEDREARSVIYCQADIVRREVASAWKTRYGLKLLPREQHLFKLNNLRVFLRVNPRTVMGTHTDKIRLSQTTDVQFKLKEIEGQIHFYYADLDPEVWSISKIAAYRSRLTPIKGRTYKDVLSSRFCCQKIVSFRQDWKHVLRQVSPSITGNNNWKHVVDIPCNCSNPSNVYFHFSQLTPDIPNCNKQWEFIRMCCKESICTLLTETDIVIMRKHLCQVLSKTSELKVGQSLFLCRFPLLTRLQLGFIHALAALFETVFLGTGGGWQTSSIHPQGVLLHKYNGINTQQDKSLLLDLAVILSDMDAKEDPTNTVLEIVPIVHLIELKNLKDILKYNIRNTATELSQAIRNIHVALEEQS